jgi:hypothetical protein
MPYPSLARGLDPEGSRIVAAGTPVSFSLPTGVPRAARSLLSRPSTREASCTEQPQEVVEDEEHERAWDRVAAIDVAKASGVVCTRVPDEGRPGRRRARVRAVAATMGEVTALGDHLRCQGIEVVTIESTSDYWRIWHAVLEAAG